MRKYLKMTGWIILYLLIYFVVTFLVESVWATIYCINYMKKASFDYENFSKVCTVKIQNNVLLMVLIAALCTLPILYLICKGRKESIFKICNIERIKFNQVLKIILVILGLALFSEGLADILVNKFSFDNPIGSALDNPEHIILSYIAVIIAGPVIEEVLFRGLILNELKKNMNIFLAITIQGILFGIYHMNMLQGIYAAILGIALGLLNYYTDTILSSIIGHILYNILGSFGVNILYYYFKFLEYPLMVIGLIVSVVLLTQMVVKKKKMLTEKTV